MTAGQFEPPWWTPRKTGTPRRSLSREAIVTAGLKVLRAEGVDGLSMRRIATELGTGPASLYAHVAGKDELLDLLFDQVVTEVPLPEPDPARWREQITELWTHAHEALRRNGDIARVALGRVPMGPNAVRMSEVSMTILRAGGVPPQAIAWALDIVGLYVSASAIEDAISRQLERSGRDPAEYYNQVAEYFKNLPAEHFPTTALLSRELATGGRDERFAFGLDLIVGGLAAQVPG
ncbi:TetR/AcrR family transcriptional regulator [Actinokineospora sp. NBRC 105648]|uniref:TetR/AcrR family transcriptional regulator n=1 Tax=Actinokineospora sp. NBRC 105648 TaxID=3032206 RepID=UPI0024A0A200|nr:TetR/AcrR family transcriptional regulator [Actinokineospora sp. NBRC 105648]GLZ41853.1 transcriptional regulator [Actinokineospora sp. NBRC 105648]